MSAPTAPVTIREELPMLRKRLHLSSAGGVLVRKRATNFGGARCPASTIRRLSVRGLPKERSPKTVMLHLLLTVSSATMPFHWAEAVLQFRISGDCYD